MDGDKRAESATFCNLVTDESVFLYLSLLSFPIRQMSWGFFFVVLVFIGVIIRDGCIFLALGDGWLLSCTLVYLPYLKSMESIILFIRFLFVFWRVVCIEM